MHVDLSTRPSRAGSSPGDLPEEEGTLPALPLVTSWLAMPSTPLLFGMQDGEEGQQQSGDALSKLGRWERCSHPCKHSQAQLQPKTPKKQLRSPAGS